jgi:hypothetical protein
VFSILVYRQVSLKVFGNNAWLRQGAKELGQAIVPAFPDSLRPVEEIGLPGNPTSQQVSLSMGLYGPRTPDRQPEIEKE